MRIVVTGGAGFIGHHLVGAALAHGHSVGVIDNLYRGSFERSGLDGAEKSQADIRDESACRGAFAGADCVIHLAAQSNVMGSESNPDFTVSTNVTGTWTVARAAEAAGVRHLVFASSREVYGEAAKLPVDELQPLTPRNLYGASKIAGEALLRALPPGFPSVSVLRLANVIGSGDSGRVVPLWLEAARRGQDLCIFGGAQLLDFVPVETVVEAFLKVAECGPVLDAVNIGSGIGTTLQQLAQQIVTLTGSESKVRVMPARGPEVKHFVADTRRMREVLGIDPPTDALARIANWYATS